ncbi:hypothetical protein OV079_27965 [Nannocystis pusilla]|uniref:Uncharacterized protein n=1 Tax=Nannocystis pusilla TaxID=889268 RepID=A0A9X3F0U3_9BACT|nr:hypothetical protein [Nannocystis pusilla]MCY1009333.1 hypothetical protein [Nannocystis pusilla]
MPSTTDFDEFITWQNLGRDDYEEIEDLYRTVQERESSVYSFERTNAGQMLVKSNSGHTLVLASEAARTAFCRYLEKTFASDHHGDIEMWAGFERAMANPNA